MNQKIVAIFFTFLSFLLSCSDSWSMKHPLPSEDESYTQQTGISLPPAAWELIIEHCSFRSRLELSHTNTDLMNLVRFDFDCNWVSNLCDITRACNMVERYFPKYAHLFSLLCDRGAIKSCHMDWEEVNMYQQHQPPAPAFQPDLFFTLLAKNNIKSLETHTGYLREADFFRGVDISSPFLDFLSKNTSLTHLRAFGDGFAQEKVFNLLAQHSSIKNLELRGGFRACKDSEKIADSFFNLLRHNTTLLTLDVSGSDLNQDFVFEMLGYNSTLQVLNANAHCEGFEDDYPRFTDKNVAALCNALKTNTTLRTLYLSDHGFTETLLVKAIEALALNNRSTPLEITAESNCFSNFNELVCDDGKIRITYSGSYRSPNAGGEAQNNDNAEEEGFEKI